jgi:ABC-type phosphate transport system ATPase subunit
MNKIDIEQLNLHYGSFHALKDVNMQVSEKRDHGADRPFGAAASRRFSRRSTA